MVPLWSHDIETTLNGLPYFENGSNIILEERVTGVQNPMSGEEHTKFHNKGKNGRSFEIEFYIKETVEWLAKRVFADYGRSLYTLDILDVGCDYGAFMNTLHDLGVPKERLVGIDPYHTINPFDLNIQRLSMVESLAPLKRHFDLAVLNHTLEHVENPHTAIRQVKKVLNGTFSQVFVAVPHASYPWAHWDGEGGHLSVWTPEWLTIFMNLHGFRQEHKELRCFREDKVEIWGLYSLETK